MADKTFSILLDFKVNNLDKIKTQLNNVLTVIDKNGIKLGFSQDSISNIKNQITSISQLYEKSFNKNTGHLDTVKFGKALKDSKIDLVNLDSQMKMFGINGINAFKGMSSSGYKFTEELKKTGNWLEKVSFTLNNTFRWRIANAALNTISGQLSKAYYFAVDLDKALTDISIVSGKTHSQMLNFSKEANISAQNLKTSTLDYARASLIFFQQGLNENAVKKMTDATIIGANIAGNTTEEMSNLLTAVMQGYELNADQVMTVVDKLSAVGAATAADFEELATGMSKVASMAKTAGVPIDQLNAQIATIVSTTKEAPETIGNSLKTIYARMLAFRNDSKGELLDEEGEGFSAPAVESALQRFNKLTGTSISLFQTMADGSKQVRDAVDVIEDIGEAWDKTNDKVAKFGLATSLAGVRQQNRLIALLNNWDDYKKTVEISLDSEGKGFKQNAIYMESYQGHLKQTQAAAESLFISLFNADDMKPILEGLTDFFKLTEDILSKLGGIPTILSIIAGVMAKTAFTGPLTNLSKSFSANKLTSDMQKIITPTTLPISTTLVKSDKIAQIERVFSPEQTAGLKEQIALIDKMIAKIHEEAIAFEDVAQNVRIVESHMKNFEITMDELGKQNKKLPFNKNNVGEIQEYVNNVQNIFKTIPKDIRKNYQTAFDEVDKVSSELSKKLEKPKNTKEINEAYDEYKRKVQAVTVELNKLTTEQKKALEGQREAAQEAADSLVDTTARQAQQIQYFQRYLSMTTILAGGLFQAFKKANEEGLNLGETVLSLGPIIGTSFMMDLPETFSEGLRGMTEEMVLTHGRLGAGIRSFASSLAKSVGPMLAITVALAAIQFLVQKIDENFVTLEEQIEATNKASEKARTSFTESTEINQQLEENKQKLEELKAIGFPTLVEQSQIEDLEKINAELEIQAKIKAKIAEIDKKAAIIEVKKLYKRESSATYDPLLGDYFDNAPPETKEVSPAIQKMKTELIELNDLQKEISSEDYDAVGRQAEADFKRVNELNENLKTSYGELLNNLDILKSETGTYWDEATSKEDLVAITDIIEEAYEVGEHFNISASETTNLLYRNLVNDTEAFKDLGSSGKQAMLDIAGAMKEIAIRNEKAFDVQSFIQKDLVKNKKIIQDYQKAIQDLKTKGNIAEFTTEYNKLYEALAKGMPGATVEEIEAIILAIDKLSFAQAKISNFEKALGEFNGKQYNLNNVKNAFQTLGITISDITAGILGNIKDLMGVLSSLEKTEQLKYNIAIKATYGEGGTRGDSPEEIKKNIDYVLQYNEAVAEVFKGLDLAHIEFSAMNALMEDIGTTTAPTSSGGGTKKEAKTVDLYAEAVRQLNEQLKHLEYTKSLLSETSQEYRNVLLKEIEIQKALQQLAAAQANALRAQGFVETSKEIQALQEDWRQAQEKIATLTFEINTSSLDEMVESRENLTDQLELLKIAQEGTIEGSDEYNRLLGEQNLLQVQVAASIEKEIAAIRNLITTGNLSAAQIEQLNDRMRDLVKEAAQIQADFKRQLIDMATKQIEIMKSEYETQKSEALEAIQDELKAEERRHKEVLKNLDAELEAQNDIIDAKLKMIEALDDERSYNNDLADLQEERQKIQERLNALILDDSEWSLSLQEDLKEELADTDREIGDLTYDYNKDLRIQNLEDLRDLYKKDVEAKRDAEDEKYELTKDSLEDQKQETERYYSDILDNEEYWAQETERIVEQTMDEITRQGEAMAAAVIAKFKAMGVSINKDLIPRIQAAARELAMLEAMGISTGGASSSIFTDIISSGNNYSSSPTTSTITQGAFAPGLTFDTETMKTKDMATGKTYTPGELIPGYTFNPTTGHYYPEYHEGGIIGRPTGDKITNLLNDLLNQRPNEATIRALIGEIMVPPKNFSNLFGNIQGAINTTLSSGFQNQSSPVTVEGGDNYYFNLNIESLTGDRSGANLLMKEINKSLRRAGKK